MADIDLIKKQLLEKKEELVARMGRIDANLQHRDNPPEKDFAESATEREDDEVLQALLISNREELKQINEALVRMDDGEYYTCAVCGDDIAGARLEAVPYTNQCINCAERNQQ